jgi:hypothetical protein
MCAVISDSRNLEVDVMDQPISEFEKAGGESRGKGLLGEFWYLLRQNKKWWLIPILVILLLFGLLMMMSGTALAPFIYTLF